MLEALIAVSSSFLTIILMTFMFGSRLTKLETQVETLIKLHRSELEK